MLFEVDIADHGGRYYTGGPKGGLGEEGHGPGRD